MKINNLFLFLLTICWCVCLTAKSHLPLKKGTTEIGGTIQLPIFINKGGNTSVGLNVAPSLKYFVANSFSLGLSFALKRQNLIERNHPWNFALLVDSAYYFDLAPIYPYLGLGGGLNWDTKKDVLFFNLRTPVGILVALNNQVALDVGVPADIYFGKGGFLGVSLPVGYLGVRAFF